MQWRSSQFSQCVGWLWKKLLALDSPTWLQPCVVILCVFSTKSTSLLDKVGLFWIDLCLSGGLRCCFQWFNLYPVNLLTHFLPACRSPVATIVIYATHSRVECGGKVSGVMCGFAMSEGFLTHTWNTDSASSNVRGLWHSLWYQNLYSDSFIKPGSGRLMLTQSHWQYSTEH